MPKTLDRVGDISGGFDMSQRNPAQAQNVRLSLDAFKATAAATKGQDAIHKITGGLLSGCHTGKLVR